MKTRRSLRISGPAQADSPLQRLLLEGHFTSCHFLPHGSNDTYWAVIADGREQARVVYKPRRGEAPLWDFPSGTLYRREYAAYLMSQALGWDFIPLTVIRDGPHGIGSVQLMVAVKPDAHYFTFRERYQPQLQRIAVFDFITNNADRRATHCLEGLDGRIWGIDHGLTFHAIYKMRTVIWDFTGQPVPTELLANLKELLGRLEEGTELRSALGTLISPTEVAAFRERLEAILEIRLYPEPGPHRSIPSPDI